MTHMATHHQEPEPLNEKERRWLRRLERVFKDMPERLLIIEGGGALTLVDREAARDFPLHDGGAGDPQVFLADVFNGNGKVAGVSA